LADIRSDNANFINFCAGKTLTNGLQVAGGSCNGIGNALRAQPTFGFSLTNGLVMGDIPSSGNMISTIITNPGPGSTIPANQDFTVDVQIANLVAGSFTNPDSTYYAAPQALQGGKIVGHTHVTIQSLGNDIATSTPPDAGTFAFFKGINDAGNGNGGLSAAVAGGLPAGVYRVCTMTSASNHQPVTMPVSR
jgi:transcription initiation factor TFIID subunit 15